MAERVEKIGDYISVIDNRNTDGAISKLMGLSIDKCYIPSVANVIGTNLNNYKVIRKGQFACSLMQVSRDQKIPIAMYDDDNPAIMSPAYEMFEVSRPDELLPEYMEMWFKRAEFDREASFYAIGGVRGSLDWDDFCRMELPIPSLPEQRKIVHDYQVITNRITLLLKINEGLEDICDTCFKSISNGASSRGSLHLKDFMVFGNGRARPATYGDIPVYGGNGIVAFTDKYNAENISIIGRVGAYCGSVYIEKKQCWISDNAIVAKSIIDDNEYFDYCLLKKLNLYNYHIGTGQQLLTQGVLNAIPCPAYSKEEICSFNQHMESVFKSINRYNAEINRLNRVCSALLSSLSLQVNDGKAKSRKSFVMTKGV